MKLHKCVAVIILFAQNTIAQEAAFIKGQFVEFVVNKDGVFYSSEGIPSGIHNTQEDFSLVADPDQNGWEVGSPAFYGDYFAPGAPMEGFAVQVDQKVYRNSALISKAKAEQAFESKAFQKRVTGLNHVVSYEGEVEQYINLKQKITFVENDIKIKFEITVKNLDSKTHQFYYSRFADNDVAKELDGSFRTINETKLQKKENAASLVRSSITDGKGYFSMFTNELNSNSTTDLTWFAKPSELYKQLRVAQKEEDSNINPTFQLGELQPNEEKTIIFYYLLSQNQEDILCNGGCEQETPLKTSFILENAIVEDSYVSSFYPDSNFVNAKGIQSVVWMKNDKKIRHRTFIKLDLSSIPRNAIITSAEISLKSCYEPEDVSVGHSYLTEGNNSGLFVVNQSWSPEEVTWNSQPTYDLSFWILTKSSESNPTKDYLNLDVKIPISRLLLDDSKDGLLLQLLNEVYLKSLLFGSMNNPDPLLRPKLKIEYTIPECFGTLLGRHFPMFV
jgi:hypothetical protein